MLFKCLKRRIEKENYESKEHLAEQISLIYANEQLTDEIVLKIAETIYGNDIDHESIDICKLRIFFAGNEIKDEHKLFQHGLNNNFKLQIMKIEL